MRRATGALFLTLLAVPFAVLADGGTLVKLEGAASIEGRKGQTVPAAIGTRVASGQTLATAELTNAVVRFDDDSIFAVGEATNFKVERFQQPRGDRGGSAIFSLLRGGFRTITGLIGKAKDDTYETRTGVATIGVRGSRYGAVICRGQCPRQFQDGLWVKGEQGIIILANAAGRLELRAGQGGYVESEASAPVRVRVTPFDDPAFAANFSFDFDFGIEVEPPRIEPEPPASPS